MTETIHQCEACCRYFVRREGTLVAVPTPGSVAALMDAGLFELLPACGLPDCAALAARLAAPRPAFRRKCPPTAPRPARHRTCPPATSFRSSCPPEREWPPASGPAATAAAREDEFQASGAADSANKILLEFFRRKENFNVPFKSTDLEAMTAAAGHASSRMNNRAIWLRKQLLPAGYYLDNDPNGTAWGLPPGSYYRLCFIEDATSISAEQKQEFLVAAGLRPAAQGELAATDFHR